VVIYLVRWLFPYLNTSLKNRTYKIIISKKVELIVAAIKYGFINEVIKITSLIAL